MIRRARRSIHLDAPPKAVFSLLTEYDAYAEWMPGILASRVLAREGDVAVVEITLQETQLVVEILTSPPRAAEFATVDALRGQRLRGGWKLSGGDADEGVTLEGRLLVDTAPIDFGARRRVRETVESALAAVRQQIARGVSRTVKTGVLRRKILEVSRHPDGLRVWIEGHVYDLPHGDKGTER